jgi:hypothetical protein
LLPKLARSKFLLAHEASFDKVETEEIVYANEGEGSKNRSVRGYCIGHIHSLCGRYRSTRAIGSAQPEGAADRQCCHFARAERCASET